MKLPANFRTLLRITLIVFLFSVIFLLAGTSGSSSWGFYVHRKVNKLAVFTLPSEMVGFYKKHIEYISEHGTDPDKRSFADPNEAVRHYIDIDYYGKSPFDSVPRKWKDAVAKYTEDTLQTNGINPWWIEVMMYRLTDAFKNEDVDKILYYSANLGHYIADACVPLHTTQYYNGRIPEQKGIHAFWETRLPELFSDEFNLFTGKAEYIPKPLDKAWELIETSHSFIDTVFAVDDYLRMNYPSDKKFSYENKGQSTVKVYSKEYSAAFMKMISGMVESQMKLAIITVGSFWYTAWINAGQPDLTKIEDKEVSAAHKKELEETEKMWKTGKPKGRPNPD
jgi:hypothetical protein